jgi:putative SOS response-associated peptidase YedK
MPVVLPEAFEWEAWLDSKFDGAAACELLRPLAADLLDVQAASPVVNSARNEGPDCLAAELPLVA